MYLEVLRIITDSLLIGATTDLTGLGASLDYWFLIERGGQVATGVHTPQEAVRDLVGEGLVNVSSFFTTSRCRGRLDLFVKELRSVAVKASTARSYSEHCSSPTKRSNAYAELLPFYSRRRVTLNSNVGATCE
jgi:hypothetical protein